MFSFENILDFLKSNFWTILIRVVILGALYMYIISFNKEKVEGFQSKNGVLSLDRMYVCPTIKQNLAHNSAILEGHIQADRVTSAKNTQGILESFTNSYKAHDCDEYFADPNNPTTPPRIAPTPLLAIKHELEQKNNKKAEMEKDTAE